MVQKQKIPLFSESAPHVRGATGAAKLKSFGFKSAGAPLSPLPWQAEPRDTVILEDSSSSSLDAEMTTSMVEAQLKHSRAQLESLLFLLHVLELLLGPRR